MKYKVDLPYPEIRVEKPNIDYAKILLNNYSGKVSEETASHLYIYQHFILQNKNKEYSEILEQISIVEMNHLEMLGKTIELLGVKPAFMWYDENKKGLIPWKANYVDYDTDIKDMINIDIKAEEDAITDYKNALKLIKDKYIQELIERIILDEELHLKIFKKMLEKIK